MLSPYLDLRARAHLYLLPSFSLSRFSTSLADLYIYVCTYLRVRANSLCKYTINFYLKYIEERKKIITTQMRGINIIDLTAIYYVWFVEEYLGSRKVAFGRSSSLSSTLRCPYHRVKRKQSLSCIKDRGHREFRSSLIAKRKKRHTTRSIFSDEYFSSRYVLRLFLDCPFSLFFSRLSPSSEMIFLPLVESSVHRPTRFAKTCRSANASEMGLAGFCAYPLSEVPSGG